MKKYLILVLSTALALTLIVGIRLAAAPQTVEVTLTTVESTSVRQTVECAGKVQNGDSREVYVEFPCIAHEVYVSEGQQVKQGEALFSVDVEATQQVLAQLGLATPGVSTDRIDNTVTAPVSGVIKTLSVQEGEMADSTEPCAIITAGGSVSIAVTVREKYISRIAVGQAVEVSGVAFNKEVYHGTVAQIAETAHQEYIGTTNETVVDAVVMLSEDEIDSSLRAGLNARATVVTEIIENALMVPYNCIGQDEEGTEYVYVCQTDGTAIRTVPIFGKECGEGVLVVSGLASGDRLVQDPEALSGQTVRVG